MILSICTYVHFKEAFLKKLEDSTSVKWYNTGERPTEHLPDYPWVEFEFFDPVLSIVQIPVDTSLVSNSEFIEIVSKFCPKGEED